RQPIDLFHKQDVAGAGVIEQPEQLRACQLGSRVVLHVPSNDLKTALGREGLELFARGVGILFVGGSLEIGTNVAHRTFSLVWMVHTILVHFNLTGKYL